MKEKVVKDLIYFDTIIVVNTLPPTRKPYTYRRDTPIHTIKKELEEKGYKWEAHEK